MLLRQYLSFRSARRTAGLVLLVSAFFAAGPDSQAQLDTTRKPETNAAFFYWKACGLMLQPQDCDQFDLAQFMDSDLIQLPPRILSLQPSALRWLLNERGMLGALDAGAQLPVCSFLIQNPGEAALDLSHLARIRSLARRALATAKAYEYADNRPGAAVIYVDLFKLTRHLDQDDNATSGFLGIELLQLILQQIEGFVCRQPPGDAMEYLQRYFKENHPPVFHLSNYLRSEARRNGDWLLAAPARAQERLDLLYGNSPSKPAVEQLATLPNDKKEQRLQAWVQDYRNRMNRLADAVSEPYSTGFAKVRAFDKERRKIADDPARGDNPLVPLMVPPATDLYQRFLLADAQFAIADILCAAALFHAEVHTWPAKLDELTLYGHRSFSKDPFSGEDFYYKLSRDLPVVVTRVPKTMSSRTDTLYAVNLAEHSKKLDQAFENAKDHLTKKGESPDEPVPLKNPSGGKM